MEVQWELLDSETLTNESGRCSLLPLDPMTVVVVVVVVVAVVVVVVVVYGSGACHVDAGSAWLVRCQETE